MTLLAAALALVKPADSGWLPWTTRFCHTSQCCCASASLVPPLLRCVSASYTRYSSCRSGRSSGRSLQEFFCILCTDNRFIALRCKGLETVHCSWAASVRLFLPFTIIVLAFLTISCRLEWSELYLHAPSLLHQSQPWPHKL